MFHDLFAAIALWIGTLWDTIKPMLDFSYPPAEEPDLSVFPLKSNVISLPPQSITSDVVWTLQEQEGQTTDGTQLVPYDKLT